MKVEGQAAIQEVFPINMGDISPKLREKASVNLNVVNNPKPNKEEVEQAVNTANEAIKISNYHLEFVVEENNTRYQVKVVDNNTGEVIREIPPDYMMKFSEKLKDSKNNDLGIILDELA